MTEQEKNIYEQIDILQKRIADDRITISDLLGQLPYKYIITRTFIKDWECHTAKCSAGFKQYFSGFSFGYNAKLENAQFYRSLRDAEFMLMHCNAEESLKEYVELKIERVEK